MSRGDSARRGRRAIARRELLVLPAVLALMVPAAPAFAQTTGTSGYKQKPPTPTTKTEPKKETAPSKESTTPSTGTAPAATTPTTTVAPSTATSPKASTLPFTGLNLTWVVGAGVLLLAAGLSIRLAQRRRPGAGG